MFSFLPLLAIVLAIVAFVRTRSLGELRESVSALEREVAELRRRLVALRRPAMAPESQPAPPPVEKIAVNEPEPAAPVEPAAPPMAEKPPLVEAPPIVVAPPRPPRPAPPLVETPRIDWERWIGIRGAAVLGGIVLALAGLLFFQYSIQHGLITPAMRVVLGLTVGIAAIVASEWLRPRGYSAAAEGLAGSGVVILYAALWAGHALYQLIPMGLCFALMVVVTVTCGFLAVRHASQFVAALGLIGGFATPLLLQSRVDRPIGLFGYVLLLDLGLLAIARRRGWPWLGLLGLCGTVLMQGLWIGFHMGPDRLVLGLAILVVFAVVFAASGLFARDEDQALSRFSQAGGIIVPFVFAIYFAARVDLNAHFRQIAILLGILCAGAGWLGRRQGTPSLGLAASAGSLGVFAVWQLASLRTGANAWESVAIAFGLALIFHVFVELDPEAPGFSGPAPAAMAACCGFLAILVLAASGSKTSSPWVWVVGWLALAALLYRHAAFRDRAGLQLVGALGVAYGLSLQHRVHLAGASFPSPIVFLGVAEAIAVAAQIVALLRRDEQVRRIADHAAAAFAAVFALLLLDSRILNALPPALALGAPLVFGVLILLAGSRRGAGGWSLVALVVTFLVQARWIWSSPGLASNPAAAQVALAVELASAGVFVAWQFVAGRLLRTERLAWYAAALAGPAAFFSAKRLWPVAVGEGSIGLLPIILGGLAAVAVAGVRRAPIADDAVRKSALTWLAGVAIGFASIAIPLQLEKSWVTVGWSLLGLALLVLWRRLDHPGLKWIALAHLAAACFRLLPTPLVLNMYPRGSIRVLNWLLYTYLVPAAALFASARLLARDEVARARAWEHGLYEKGRAVGAIAASLAGIVVGFIWINVAIADWFAEGARLTLQLGRSPARDLTVSIGWAIYALVLLGFGMARANIALRWLSLSFLVLTIGKVFLYDLGELRDLYRVVSLVGLAVSLLLVSLLYQRFVFRRS